MQFVQIERFSFLREKKKEKEQHGYSAGIVHQLLMLMNHRKHTHWPVIIHMRSFFLVLLSLLSDIFDGSLSNLHICILLSCVLKYKRIVLSRHFNILLYQIEIMILLEPIECIVDSLIILFAKPGMMVRANWGKGISKFSLNIAKWLRSNLPQAEDIEC